MSYQKKLIHLLDRPGGRLLLGSLATHEIQRDKNRDMEIRYINGLWTRRVGQDFFPDGPRFQYEYSDFGSWRNQIRQYESDTREYWFRHYHPLEGDIIVDVGAGRGEDTLSFSKAVGPVGRVIAIEAHPLSFAILQSFCRLNHLHNVTALNVALMDQPGMVRMAESATDWQENTVARDSEAGGMTVPASTLDKICEQAGIQTVDFLKMNIEGAEREAILGMVRTLPNTRHLCIACHDFRADLKHGEKYRTRRFIENRLREVGFTITNPSKDERNFVRDHVFGSRLNDGDLPIHRC